MKDLKQCESCGHLTTSGLISINWKGNFCDSCVALYKVDKDVTRWIDEVLNHSLEPIAGIQSLDECRKSIRLHAVNISNDISSTSVNAGRIASLRSLLDLFEQYNEKLIILENDNTK